MVGGTLEWWTSSVWHPEGSYLWVGGTRSGTSLLKCWRMNWMACLGFLSFGSHCCGSSPTAAGWNLPLLRQDHAVLLLTASPPRGAEIPVTTVQWQEAKVQMRERILPPVSSWLVLTTWHGPLLSVTPFWSPDDVGGGTHGFWKCLRGPTTFLKYLAPSS